MMVGKQPQDQTNEEWRRAYDGEAVAVHGLDRAAGGVHPESVRKDTLGLGQGLNVIPETRSNDQSLIGEFIYIEHRTTSRSRLVLEFLHLETGKSASMFFNVQIQSKKSKKYPVGRGGQFTCNRNTKFAKFWMAIFKSPPRRWSRAHHELSKLKKLSLSGVAVLKERKDGTGSYWELVELKRSE